MGRPLGARDGRCADAAEGGRIRLGAAAGRRPSSAIKAAFRAEKAGALVRLAKDVGRVGEKAGMRGALDTLKIAEGPKDVARAARLAESKGGQTRAILKLLGRGALLLAAGAFNLTLWVFGALLALFGLLSSIKATTERLTMAWLRRKKARRLRKQMAAAALLPEPGAGGRRRARLGLRSAFDRPSDLPTNMELTMPSFHNGAVEIAYLDEGEGDPIVLVHGFASSKNVNWVYPTWVSELKKDGRRVIALDNRGHGDSGKLYDAAQYEIAIMAGDVIALMDHLEHRARRHHGLFAGRADDGGAGAAASRSGCARRFSAASASGLIEGGGPGENVARGAGGAVARGRHRSGRADVSRLRRPDPLRPPGAGRLPARLAAPDDARGSRRHHGAGADRGRHRGRNRGLGAGARQDHSGRARCSTFPNRDHMRAVGDKVYKAGVLDFLSRRK